MNDKKLYSSMVRKMKKLTPSGFVPQTVSIYKLCEKAEKLCYFNQIRNRIYWELENNENMADYVRLDPNNMADILLDDDGIFVFSDILMGYFQEQDIIDLWRYVRDINRYDRAQYDFEHLFDKFSTRDLSKFITEYSEYIPKPEEEETKKELLKKAHRELRKRKRLSFI